ncbi:MAG: MerR family transcriptional regulator [Muricomes sp.]
MISEAAKQVKVESHVLRYWEESWPWRLAAQRWDIDIIRKTIYNFSAVLRN